MNPHKRLLLLVALEPNHLAQHLNQRQRSLKQGDGLSAFCHSRRQVAGIHQAFPRQRRKRWIPAPANGSRGKLNNCWDDSTIETVPFQHFTEYGLKDTIQVFKIPTLLDRLSACILPLPSGQSRKTRNAPNGFTNAWEVRSEKEKVRSKSEKNPVVYFRQSPFPFSPYFSLLTFHRFEEHRGRL